ncbi:hypothetical protein NQ314_011804 [Rhamnusium bicolor]|uniref:Glucose-methanol-choline oxidoreductase N-terminal domain-containing protein n=1 Tax=Rhamnusium bicolor TaxID=1586634 RepID=A0AAV8XG63_9CUCU|nr:hypothetical protein NQ314_011804 [Rhamnusium bicolor]
MCLGLEEKKMPCPRGKALGGSSVLNLMMYVRGNKWDYDQWEEEGNPVSNIDYRYHGKNGYLGIENSYRSLLTETFLDGAEEIGLPEIDYNAPTKSFGVSPLQATLWNGRRNSVARAFLHPIIHRNNLDIVIGAFVTKILINEETKEAYGVQYEKNNQSAINSPQLLILSGIGPKDHLNELGIKCIKDLPVGKNLQDHLTFYGVVYIIKFDYDQTYFRLATSVSDYVHFGEGPLTTVGGVEGVGFIKTSESTTEVDQPDIELMFIRSSIAADLGNWGKSAFKLTDEVYDSFFKPLQAKYHWSICPILLHPKTRGYLKLQSKDPYDQPLIYLKYLADPENKDVKTMIAGIRFIQKLANTTAFRKMGARLHDLSVHGCEEMVFDSDEYWECALRTMALTLYHLLGTAKMGPRGDPTAVVNNHLQVYGIHSLRVCDCSVIPNQISGHTNAIAIAIGEKCADYIKEYWRGR